MSLTIDGQANSIASSVGGVNIPATVGTLSVGPSGSYMNVTSSGIAATTITATNITSGSVASTNITSTNITTTQSVNATTLKSTTIQHTNGTSALNIDSAGRVTMPSQPSFCASKSDSEQTTSGTIIFNDVSNPGRHNVGNHYSTSTGTFTCPVAGRYVFMCSIHATNGTNRVDVRLRINGSDAPGGFALNNIDSYTQATGCAVLNVAANDAITIYNNSAGVWPDAGLTYFSGYLVG